MSEKFSQNEIFLLRSNLIDLQPDQFQAAEMIRVFVAGHGYGIGTEAACEVAGCLKVTAYNLTALRMHLEARSLAM